MLTPNETLGLSGATLETRMRQALRNVPDALLRNIHRRLREDALSNEVVYERDGVNEPVRIMLRPLLVMPEQVAYLHHTCAKLVDALKRLPELYLAEAAVRDVLHVAPEEDAWLRQTWSAAHGRSQPLYARLDAVCDFSAAGWRESLKFMEPNLTGVGGIHFAPVAEQLVMRDVVPALLAHDPALAIELPRDQRALFLQVLLDHAQLMGRAGRNICFIEPKYETGGPNEQPALARHLRDTFGATVVHADPTELRLVGAEVYYENTCIDVAYRDYEVRDLIALGASTGHDLAGMRALLQQNRVVSSIGGDFDHKSAWEILTDEALAQRYFSAEECQLFRRHVLWTRRIFDRRTTLPQGEGHLLDFVRSHREELVLKPNRGYGGTGVHVGRATDAAEWDSLIEQAVAEANDPDRSWIVQAATPLPVCELPVVDADGRVHEEPFFVVMGFAPTEGGLGTLCRVSQKQVVNVAQRGGLAAVLIGHPPSTLHAPVRSAPRARVAQQQLDALIGDVRGLDTAINVLGWDEETYLPAGARVGRGAQLGVLESMKHRLLASDRLGDLLPEVASDVAAGSVKAAELERLARLRRLALVLPEDLVRAFAQARSHGLDAWEQARARDEYALFAPALAQLLTLVKERAQALRCSDDLYDGVLDEHEPGMRRARLDPVLHALRSRLLPLAQELAERSAGKTNRLPAAQYSDSAQERFCRALLERMGFDFTRGRLDRSTHPFTLMAGDDDVRVTIRVDEANPLSAMFATLHEGGHGLYDQGYGAHVRGTLLAEGPGMGIHESQSRLWENHVGRSAAFSEYVFEALRQQFPAPLASLNAQSFYEIVNVVRPGFNRVEADEVTYNLHILLRYELELGLLNGSLSVDDLPAAWSDASQTLFGIRPQTALQGCLQDVHWALGSFGYFPTYTLGNLYAAQLVEAFAAQRPSFEQELRAGELGHLLAWLRQNVHLEGHRVTAEEIMLRATGSSLSSDAFFRMLAHKHASTQA